MFRTKFLRQNFRQISWESLLKAEALAREEVSRRLAGKPNEIGLSSKRDIPGYLECKSLQKRISRLLFKAGNLSWKEGINQGLFPDLFKRFFSLKEKFLPRSKSLGPAVLAMLGVASVEAPHQVKPDVEPPAHEIKSVVLPRTTRGASIEVKPQWVSASLPLKDRLVRLELKTPIRVKLADYLPVPLVHIVLDYMRPAGMIPGTPGQYWDEDDPRFILLPAPVRVSLVQQGFLRGRVKPVDPPRVIPEDLLGFKVHVKSFKLFRDLEDLFSSKG